MLKSMKKIYLVLEMVKQSSLLILEMMIKTMMIYKLNSLFYIPNGLSPLFYWTLESTGKEKSERNNYTINFLGF
uniref:Uncharacterized protein n=1 Tax=Monodon monoceros TaxID=40151 RepID=A0A8C6BIK8_MONMO